MEADAFFVSSRLAHPHLGGKPSNNDAQSRVAMHKPSGDTQNQVDQCSIVRWRKCGLI